MLAATRLFEILKRCIDKNRSPGMIDLKDSDIKWIADELARVDRIEREIGEWRQKAHDLKVEYLRQLEAVEVCLKATRDGCPHYLTTYYSDPAGGSDSWTECDTCGASV